MKCCECGKGMSEGVSLLPVDPEGTVNRRWACLECIPSEVVESLPTDLVEICKIFTETFGNIYGEDKVIDTKVNICDTCLYERDIPKCLPNEDGVSWGNGLGNDNIIKCKNYEERPGAVMLGMLVTLNEKLDVLLDRRNG